MRKLLIILLACSLFSCKEGVSNKFPLETSNWNKLTSNYIDIKCDIKIKQVPEFKELNLTTEEFSKHIYDFLSMRKILRDILINKHFKTSEIIIYEVYKSDSQLTDTKKQKAFYRIEYGNDNVLTYSIGKDGEILEHTEVKDSVSIATKEETDFTCINDLPISSVPNKLSILTKVENVNNELQYKIIFMSLDI